MRETSMRIINGLSEGVRVRVMAFYREKGGRFSRVNTSLLREALKAVRRQLEDEGSWAAADDLTCREDVLAAESGE